MAPFTRTICKFSSMLWQRGWIYVHLYHEWDSRQERENRVSFASVKGASMTISKFIYLRIMHLHFRNDVSDTRCDGESHGLGSAFESGVIHCSPDHVSS